jgi:ligand-binding sensor domain-containing protein/CheY-like chemotaxis protein
VWSIYQDEQGVLWFGEIEGVIRYDGVAYEPLGKSEGLPGTPVLAIQEFDGAMFFGTPNGLGVMAKDQPIVALDQFKDLVVRVLVKDDRNRLWIGTGSGLYRYEQGIAELVLADRDIRAVAYLDNKLWVGTYEGVLLRKTEGSPGDEWVEIGDTKRTIRSILPFQKKVAVGANSGFFVVRHDRLEPFDLIPGQSLNLSHCVTDRDGILWLSTWGQGIYQVDLARNRILHFSVEDGLPTNFITFSMRDYENNLWFSCLDGGVIKYGDRHYVHYNAEEGRSRSVTRLVIDSKNHKWFTGPGLGLMRLAHGTIQAEVVVADLPVEPAYDLFVDREDRVYLLLARSMLVVESDLTHRWISLEHPERKGTFRWLHQDRQDTLWIGGSKGIGQIRDDVLVDVTPEGDFRKRFWHATELDEDIIMFASSDELWRVRDGVWERCHYPQERHHEIRHMIQVDNRLFMATDNGLLHLDAADPDATYHFYQETELMQLRFLFVDSSKRLWIAGRKGVFELQGGVVTQQVRPKKMMGMIEKAIEDQQGFLWFISHNGVLQFDGQKWFERQFPPGIIIQAFDPVVQDTTGSLWFATNKGITEFRPSAANYKLPAPKLADIELRVGEHGLFERLTPGETVTLNYHQRPLVLRFRTMSFINEDDNEYQFQLSGPLNDQVISTAPERNWAILPPGQYTVALTGENALNIPSQTPVRIHLNIKGPLWQKPYFYPLVLVILGLMIWLLSKWSNYRHLQLLRQANVQLESELEEKTHSLVKAKEVEAASAAIVTLSHEIAQPLSAILGYLDRERQRGNGRMEKVEHAVMRIATLMKKLWALEQVDYTQYTGDVKMIDLGTGGKVAEIPAGGPSPESDSSGIKVGPTVLFVDDEGDLLEIWQEFFQENGYRVHCARDGHRGLAQALALGDELDLIVSDNKMPGMTGVEMAKALAQEGRKTPVFLLTGYPCEGEEAFVRQGNIAGVFFKPMSLYALQQAIEGVLLKRPNA